MVRIEVRRKLVSHFYLRDTSKPFDWHNNDAHNSLDDFIVLVDEEVRYKSSCQSVANMEGLSPGFKYTDTLKAGNFGIKAFVEKRAFKCEVHGIVTAETLSGEVVGADSCVPSSELRTLIHDWQGHSWDSVPGDTRVAWSDNCIIIRDADLSILNSLLRSLRVVPGMIIPALIVEEA